MPFINEVVSDADIDRYGLPFAKGSGRYWTRDAERDYYLWGGKGGNPAFGEDFEGRFHLSLNGFDLFVCLVPGEGSFRLSDVPFVVVWRSVKRISPSDLHGLDRVEVLRVLKEALSVYGRNGRAGAGPCEVSVVCQF